MVLELIIASFLGFLVFLSFSLPTLANEKGFQWWEVRNIYHVMIFSSAGMLPVFVRSINSAVIFVITGCIFFLSYYWITKANVVSKFYDIMKREDVSASERSIYTATTNLFLFILLIINWNTPVYFAIGMLVMAMGDSMAEVIGRTAGEIEYQVVSTKTIRGSVTVFVVSMVVVSSGLFIDSSLQNYSYFYLILVAMVAMIAESMSFKFLDNVLMPYLTAFALKYPLFDLF